MLVLVPAGIGTLIEVTVASTLFILLFAQRSFIYIIQEKLKTFTAMDSILPPSPLGESTPM